MSKVIRRAHLVLVAAFGKRIADPPQSDTPLSAARRRQAEAMAVVRARQEQKHRDR